MESLSKRSLFRRSHVGSSLQMCGYHISSYLRMKSPFLFRNVSCKKKEQDKQLLPLENSKCIHSKCILENGAERRRVLWETPCPEVGCLAIREGFQVEGSEEE